MARRDRRPHGSKPRSPYDRPYDVRPSREAIEAQRAYDQAIESTPEGARSKTLRERAEVESARGHDQAAHALYLEAAALFAEDDDSAAAAACWYDLGESYSRLTIGVHEENQLLARALFERALRSPMRQRTPLRLALTHDALGRTARTLAIHRSSDERAQLDEAERHLGRACSITESLGLVGLVDAAGYRHNHGNLLMQRGRWDDAERSFRRALDHLAAARRDPDQLGFLVRRPMRPLEPMLHLGLARMQLQRGRRSDLASALRGLDRVIHDGDAPMVAEAHLHAAMALLRDGPYRGDEARTHLRAVTLWDLEPDQRRVYLRTLRDSGDAEIARRALRLALTNAMRRRAATIADHMADHGAHEAQEISLLAAELHADDGRPVEAFLALEESAALRYFESVHAQGWSPRDAISLALAQRRDATAAGARMLDDLASRIAYLQPAELRAVLDEFGQALERNLVAADDPTAASEFPGAEVLAETARVQRRFIEALRLARPAPSASAVLREVAGELGAESLHANEVLTRRDPEADHRTREGSSALEPAGLHRLLDEHPGDVLLRVSLGRDLLAVGVWLDGGALTGRTLRRPLAEHETRALVTLYASASERGIAPVGKSVTDILTVLLPALDVNDALPERAIEHLVVLPSTLAALIPWAAAGGPGRTLLDRADAISYLPNLAPRVTQQHVSAERTATVLVAPGIHCHEHATRFHDVAFSALRGGETALLGADATRERMVREAERADVVSLYTHGLHIPQHGAALSLAGGSFSLDELDSRWWGCERVELWACQSGVNHPTDWLTPMVDEAFGIDVAFHHVGVRSTIGSLWSVPALVTAHLVRRYREGLAAGRSSPQALADAQRWWRDTVVAKLPGILASTPEYRVSDAIARLLGTDASRDDLDATLGAMQALIKESDQAMLLREFSTPAAWAGFRFLGVAGRHPVVGSSDAVRPLTAEERAGVETLLSESHEPGQDVDAFHRERLAAAVVLGHDEHPTPEQATRVARAYAERGLGSMRHNLLRALAWVHEALAVPSLAAADRGALTVEAAWLWTELARGELDAERLRPLFSTDRVLVQRARALLGGCAAASEAPLLRAWVDRLDQRTPAPADEDLRRWPSLRGAVETCVGRWSKLRAAALAVEWLLSCDEVPQAIVREGIDLADTAIGAGGTRDTYFVAQRLLSSRSMLALRVGQISPPPPPHVLSAREIARSAEWHARADEANPDLGVDGRTVASEALDRLEGIHWGTVDDDLTDFWDSTGTPGVAWQRVASGYFTTKFRGASEPRLALHHLASMQLGADLRVGALHRQAHLLPVNAGGELPGTAAWSREHVLQGLEDLARLAEFDAASASVRPSSVDGFRQSAAELLDLGARSSMAHTAWDVASTVTEDQDNLAAARTGAFLIERALLPADAAMHENWNRVRAGAATFVDGSPDAPAGALTAFLQNLAPPRRIDDLEAWLRGVPAGRVVLGASIGAGGELLLSVVGGVDCGPFMQTSASSDTLGWQVLEDLRGLLSPDSIDHTPHRGTDATRAEALAHLCALLDGPLGRCFVDLPHDRPQMLSVFAPGALRALPWWALTAGGVALRDRFAAVTHLPCLGFGSGAPSGDGSRVFCAFGEEREVGETRFGACAVESLRKYFPGTLAAEPSDTSRGSTIVETALLSEVAAQVEVVRWYGVGTPYTMNPSTEGLALSDGRTLTRRNLLGTVLPHCRRVEYWAATADAGALIATTTGDREVFPQLVWSALAAGAGGVLDLAWPVHDLVKALVCERFGIVVRRHVVPGPVALGLALRGIAAVLARWGHEAPRFDSTRAALAWLDEGRRVQAREAGLDVGAVAPFAPHADAPCVGEDVDALVRVCTSPMQLGAFRWWGN